MRAGHPKSVMLLHNSYQQRGGEDAVVEHEAELLRDAGVKVHIRTISNDAIRSISAKVDTVFNAKGDWGLARKLASEAREKSVDLVHIHNFWPLITPAAHIALADAGFPVVQTLHNYRLLCANGMLAREGDVCEACLSGSRFNAIRHRCYRGSIAGSAAALAMQDATIGNPAWVQSVSRFVVLTQFARSKLVQAGLPSGKIVVKGNSLADPPEVDEWEGGRSGFLFVGRVAEGKGVDLFIQAAKQVPEQHFTVLGDGPLLEQLAANASDNVEFLGQVSRPEVFAQMRKAQWLVMPSTWYEGFPIVLVEALAHGLPVIVPRIGGLPDLIGNGEAGLVFEAGSSDSLTEAIKKSCAEQALATARSQAARAYYKTHFNAQSDCQQLLDIYGQAIKCDDKTAVRSTVG